MLAIKIALTNVVESWIFGGIHLRLNLRSSDPANGHCDWTERGRYASVGAKIKLSAQFFIRACQNYNTHERLKGNSS